MCTSTQVRAAYKADSQDNLTVLVVVFPWAKPALPEVEQIESDDDNDADDDDGDDDDDRKTKAVDDELDMFA